MYEKMLQFFAWLKQNQDKAVGLWRDAYIGYQSFERFDDFFLNEILLSLVKLSIENN